MYAQLVREGCTPNLVTFNILIDIYGKTSQWQEAVKVLDALQAQVLLQHTVLNPLALGRLLSDANVDLNFTGRVQDS